MSQPGQAQHIEVPEWVNNQFLQDSLRKGLKNKELIVQDCEFSAATAVGDNYGSQMIRARITIKKSEVSDKESFSCILKIAPLGFFEGKMGLVFQKEAHMFTKTLPAMHDLLLEVYPDHERSYAFCYDGQNKPDDFILLEDLRPSGFTLADRFGGLDMDHSLLVLKEMAKQHAASVALTEKDPEEIVFYDGYPWQKKYEEFVRRMFGNAIPSIRETIKNTNDFPEKDKYGEKLKGLQDTFLDRFYESFARNEDAFNVIIHGDCWTNNMMFRYDDNSKVKAIKFLDFQNPTYNAPVLDVMYFIYTSSQGRFMHESFFLEKYHQYFTEAVKRLNIQLKKSFTLEDLKSDFEKRLMYGLFILLSIVPITCAPPQNAMITGDGENFNPQLYGHAPLISILRKGLPYFEQRGLF